ncbi:MAG: MotA/TolQ/ExbB proton channel family protein [Rhodospirillaceae bacterium]|nr:MotA/TolQ/ExbB proton channel family protein [Rhodospirillaceae bacterium]
MDPQILTSATNKVDALSIGLAQTGQSWSFIQLFLKADFIVQTVMVLLIFASISCWAIIADKTMGLRRFNKNLDVFRLLLVDTPTWAELIDAIKLLPSGTGSKIIQGILAEWDYINNTVRAANDGEVSLTETENRLEKRVSYMLQEEIASLEKGLSVLASTGSVAPFVGLFGTVWGIMNSFMSIAASQDNSLAIVAPGVAEALMATAFGLVAAIPAVLAYNRLSASIYHHAQKLEIFASQAVKMVLHKLGQEGKS